MIESTNGKGGRASALERARKLALQSEAEHTPPSTATAEHTEQSGPQGDQPILSRMREMYPRRSHPEAEQSSLSAQHTPVQRREQPSTKILHERTKTQVRHVRRLSQTERMQHNNRKKELHGLLPHLATDNTEDALELAAKIRNMLRSDNHSAIVELYDELLKASE